MVVNRKISYDTDIPDEKKATGKFLIRKEGQKMILAEKIMEMRKKWRRFIIWLCYDRNFVVDNI